MAALHRFLSFFPGAGLQLLIFILMCQHSPSKRWGHAAAILQALFSTAGRVGIRPKFVTHRVIGAAGAASSAVDDDRHC